MRYKLFFTLSAMLMLAATCHKKDDDGREGLIIESNFEGSNPFRGWDNDQHCCDYSLSQSHDQFSEGNSSLRVELRSTDPEVSSSIRSELVQDADPIGTERWYGFNIFLENWSDDNAGESVFQWHPNNLTGTGTASLWTSGGRYVYETNTGGANSEYTDVGPIISNKWVSWVIHVKWADDNTGIMQVWKEGKIVIDKKGIQTAPPEGTYFKLGMNKWGWLGQTTTPLVTKRVFYFDEVRIGGAKSSYEDVQPGP